jgi:hypothetical protein
MGVEPQPATVLTREEVDRAIAGMAAVHSLASTLLSIEDHPGHRYLREHTLAGRTKEVWRDLKPQIQLMWAQYTALSTVLQQVRRLRERRDRPGQQKFVELTRLLGADAVGLGPDGMPVEDAADLPAERLSPAELGDRVNRACASTLVVLVGVQEASGAVTARLSTLAGALSQIRDQAASLGLRQELELDPLVTAFAELGRSAVEDPLGSAGTGAAASGAGAGGSAAGSPGADDPAAGAVGAGLHRLEVEVAAISRRLADLAAVRQEFPHRLAALQRRADSLASTEEVARRTLATATVKIIEPGLRPYTERLAGVRAGLAAVERHGRAHRWPLVAEQLPAVERLADQALVEAGELVGEASALLARRDELRGRLDSYRVKADRLGFGEHADLTAAYRHAWDLLWTAPCDLRAATSAVRRYQDLLADPPHGDGGTGS